MPECSIDIRIEEAPFAADDEAAAFRRAHGEAGAVVCFIGQVRGEQGAVSRLTLEHYPGFTEKNIARIVAGAAAAGSLDGVLVIHRVGEMEPGEPIVLVAAAARHRRDAFSAVERLMDYLKTDAPFWKKETSNVGTRWIEPRSDDHAARARWTDNK